MKRIHRWISVLLVIFCIAMLVSLSSCSADMKIGDNTELGEQFLNSVINDDYDTAYDLVKQSVSNEDFSSYWSSVRSIVEGSRSYEIEQIGWNINTQNSVTSNTTAYKVYFDNGKIVLFRVVTVDDIDGIAGVHCSDITDFITTTDAFVPIVNVVLTVISLLAIAFSVWMLVDCIRRKVKLKVLWLILIFLGLSFSVTVGQKISFNFMLGLMLQFSTILADPAIVAVKTTIVVPAGAILYFCLRKKLTIPKISESEEEKIEETFEISNETKSQATANDNIQTSETDDQK